MQVKAPAGMVILARGHDDTLGESAAILHLMINGERRGESRNKSQLETKAN